MSSWPNFSRTETQFNARVAIQFGLKICLCSFMALNGRRGWPHSSPVLEV